MTLWLSLLILGMVELALRLRADRRQRLHVRCVVISGKVVER